MIKGFICILLLSFFINVSAQSFSKKDFVKTDWFTENIDSLFFKSDTIRLIKHSNKGPEWAKDEYAESQILYLKHGDYLNFRFKMFGNFEYWETSKNYINIVPIANFTWKFDKRKQSVIVFKNKVLFFELKPISIKEIKLESRFAEQKDLLKTIEVTFFKWQR